MCVIDVVPPTVFLPPLKLLQGCSNKEICHAIASLRHIYLPEVRGSTRRRHGQHFPRPAVADTTHVLHSHLALDSYHIKEKAKSSDLSAIRADPFERTFAIQWLTRFVSLFSEVVADSPGSPTVSSQALEEAASLLAICAGSAASGTVIRTFAFPLSSGMCMFQPTIDKYPDSWSPSLTTIDLGVSVSSLDFTFIGDEEISVTLHDAPLESSDFSSVGAQTWGGSCILAEMIAENPRNFSIHSREDVEPSSLRLHANAPFRALELGAGTGLASLVLGKVLGRIRGVHHRDTVVATDFHPSVLANLRLNFAVNFPPELFDSQTHTDDDRIPRSSETPESVPSMVVLPLDWSVIHLLAYPISSPRIGSSVKSSDTEDTLPNQIPTPRKDTTAARHHRALHPDTSSQSQPQTLALDQTDIICDPQQLSGDIANVQTTASPFPIAPQLDIPFDLIIGADIIYEHSHARWVRTCVERFLRKPSRPLSQADRFPIRASAAAAPGHYSLSDPSPLLMDQHPTTALFHLVVPLRHTHAVECHSIEEVFPQAADILLSRQLGQKATIPPQPSNNFGTAKRIDIPRYSDEPISLSAHNSSHFVALELAIISQEDIWCDAYSDREEGEVVYRYYRIGWV